MKKLIAICILVTLSFGDSCLDYANSTHKMISLIIMDIKNNDVNSLISHRAMFNYYIDLAIIECKDKEIVESLMRIKQSTLDNLKGIK